MERRNFIKTGFFSAGLLFLPELLFSKNNLGINEFEKCKNDPIYFIEKYFYKLYPYQKQMIQEFETYEKNIYKKGRNIGISQLLISYSLWKSYFYNNTKILFISPYYQTVRKNKKEFIKYYEQLMNTSSVFRRGYIASLLSNDFVSFYNNSKIDFISSGLDYNTHFKYNKNNYDLYILDEMAHFKNIPIIKSDKRIIITTTPTDISTKFHDIWKYGKGFNRRTIFYIL